MSDATDITAAVGTYYGDKIRTFGATPRGVDWRDQDSQEVRFRQLCRLFEDRAGASVLDLGCGFGSMIAYLRQLGFSGDYIGIDISDEMIAKAKDIHGADPRARFLCHPDSASLQETADVAVASGIFNVRLGFDDARWEEYILATLHDLNRIGLSGFAFNCLTSYSDADKMQDYLYYADPCRLFDYCKRNFSKQVALLHDYGLYEFTLIVRKA
jgi:SAM-dependent methyltransferase